MEWRPDLKPKYCCWVLTYKCMFRCKMCYIWETEDIPEGPTLEEKKNFVSSLKGFVDDNFEFHLSGGEPLLDKDIFDIIRHITSFGYKTNMVTNGWLVTEDAAKKLGDAGLNSITFSLDGINPATHDFLRGMRHSYDKIMNAVEIMAKYAPNVSKSVIMLINGYNLDEVLPLADWVERNGDLEMISFQVITQPFSRPRDDHWFKKGNGVWLWPDKKDAGEVMEELYKRRKAGAKIGNSPNHFLAFKKYFENPNRFLKSIKCTMGDYEFHVDPYGKVFFCCFVSPVGNIKDGPLPKLWSSPETGKIREEVYNCRKNCHIMINCFFEDESCSLK